VTAPLDPVTPSDKPLTWVLPTVLSACALLGAGIGAYFFLKHKKKKH